MATGLKRSNAYQFTLPLDHSQSILQKLPVSETTDAGEDTIYETFQIKPHKGKWNVAHEHPVEIPDRLTRALDDQQVANNGKPGSPEFEKARLQMILSYVLANKRRNTRTHDHGHDSPDSFSSCCLLNFEVNKTVELVGLRRGKMTLFRRHLNTKGSDVQDLIPCMAMVHHARMAAGLQARTIYGLLYNGVDWYFFRLCTDSKLCSAHAGNHNFFLREIVAFLSEIIDQVADLSFEG